MSSKPNPTSDHQIVHRKILEYFEVKTGYFRGHELWRYCKPYTKRAVYPDTVLRYLRELREENKLNYEVVGEKADSMYRIVK